MTDKRTNGQTEFPLVDSTPVRGRVKTVMWSLANLESTEFWIIGFIRPL